MGFCDGKYASTVSPVIGKQMQFGMMTDNDIMLQNFLCRANQRMNFDLIQTFLNRLTVFVFGNVMNAENRHNKLPQN